MKIGIISLKDYKRRTINIARGTYIPKKDEPKIWFESFKNINLYKLLKIFKR